MTRACRASPNTFILARNTMYVWLTTPLSANPSRIPSSVVTPLPPPLHPESGSNGGKSANRDHLTGLKYWRMWCTKNPTFFPLGPDPREPWAISAHLIDHKGCVWDVSLECLAGARRVGKGMLPSLAYVLANLALQQQPDFWDCLLSLLPVFSSILFYLPC